MFMLVKPGSGQCLMMNVNRFGVDWYSGSTNLDFHRFESQQHGQELKNFIQV